MSYSVSFTAMIKPPVTLPISQTINAYNKLAPFSGGSLGTGANGTHYQNISLQSNTLSTQTAAALRNQPSDYSYGSHDDLAKNLTDFDDLKGSDETVNNIYDGVVAILALRIKNWLSTDQQVKLIAYYLGAANETRRVINHSITQLFYLQQRGKIRISNLLNVFFYSCDIGNMIQDQSELTIANVRKKLSSILKTLRADEINHDSKQIDENDLVKSLKSNTELVDEKFKPSLSVTIPLMKNRVYVDYSKKSDLDKVSFVDKSCNFVKANKDETDGAKIIKNHVDLLGELIPDIFGLAYNHIELLQELERFGLDESEGFQIQRFSNFLGLFRDIFLSRYFEFKFKHKIDQEFENLLQPLVDFLNFEVSESSLYMFSSGKYHESMWNSLNGVMEKLLFYTNGKKTSVKSWKDKRTLKMDIQKNSDSKTYYLNLINCNTEDSYDILGTFASNFEQGAQLYRDHGLNLSQWPVDIY